MEEQGIGTLIWTFVNSPLGISILGAILVTVMGFIFKAKPGWEKIYHEYKPMLVDAVKFAEKTISDDTENKAMAKADAALKFILKAEGQLSKKKETDLKKAITAAHANWEKKTNGNGAS